MVFTWCGRIVWWDEYILCMRYFFSEFLSFFSLTFFISFFWDISWFSQIWIYYIINFISLSSSQNCLNSRCMPEIFISFILSYIQHCSTRIRFFFLLIIQPWSTCCGSIVWRNKVQFILNKKDILYKFKFPHYHRVKQN